MYGGGYNAYKETHVTTADPKRLVIMCYEEAIRSLNLAAEMYSSKKYMAKGEAVQKGVNIINELRGALDFERGGLIAKNLDALYAFMIKYIIIADTKRDIKSFSQVASMLEELKYAFEKAFNSLQGQEMARVSRSGGDYTPQSIEYLR